MRGFAAVGFHHMTKKPNFGGALRACSCYKADLMVMATNRPLFWTGYRDRQDTSEAYRHIPLVMTDNLLSVRPVSAKIVAIELTDDSESLVEFIHPDQAYYVFGPEAGNVPKDILQEADHVVKVPTSHCMNVSATVNVVLYDRLSKQIRNC